MDASEAMNRCLGAARRSSWGGCFMTGIEGGIRSIVGAT
ncbi:MAG: hypothetical protein JWM98_850, partial [Thermoleophilia bacterium]|nr:hypothetical protein [Thermoleophilia bacterium]